MVRRYCCHPIPLSLPSSSPPPSSWSSLSLPPLSSMSSSSSSSLLSHLPTKKKELLKKQILKSRVKDVVHSHIDFYTGDIGCDPALQTRSRENDAISSSSRYVSIASRRYRIARCDGTRSRTFARVHLPCSAARMMRVFRVIEGARA